MQCQGGPGMEVRSGPPGLARPSRLVVRATWVPEYGTGLGALGSKGRRSPEPSKPTVWKNWWQYKAPGAASFGPSGYQIRSVSIPEYGFGNGGGGGSGGNGGGGGGGGGGGNGDPMKGFTYLFGLLVFAGGLAAYVRKGSSKSLLVASAVAALLLISGSLMGHPTYRVGTLLALGTCLALAGVMGSRASASGKVFPAGVVALLSGLMSVGYLRTLA